jgi:hypothetical protein
VRVKHKLGLGAVVAAAVAGSAGVAALALAAAPAAAEPPVGGLFVPGRSVAGVELGMTRAGVLATWGRRHGVCRDCDERTWYFNEVPFRPQGTGVVFEDGRVAHAFTVWKPEGWTTPEGLELGAPGGEIGETYGELTERRCPGYLALVRDGSRADTAFYVYEDELWGFGLVRPGRSPCL